jgi:6-phosphogluconolactonase
VTDHELRTLASPEALAVAACAYVVELAERAIADRGIFQVAVSGGHTPQGAFAALAASNLDWEQVRVYQVDERVTPPGPRRNLTGLRSSLGDAPAKIVAMPVDDEDLEASALAYGAALPERFDLVHLGLGVDGHTASLVPEDPVLEVTDRPVAVTGPYQGERRMTLTYPGLARADRLLWLVSGAEKRDALVLLLEGDTSIPAGRVQSASSLIMTDETASP